MKVRQMLPQRKRSSFEWRSWRVMLSGTVAKNAGKLALSLVIGLALFGFLPIPVQAQEPIDLELGGEGATSWDIGNIQPGDTGTKTVTLRNAGYRDGFVTVWISDIVSSEGANPESETGDTTEPGELVSYLLFDLSCIQLNTNLGLPAVIENFPQSASSWVYIRVSPLNAGDTVNLHWLWELPYDTGNEIQGDSLSFTIHYVLEEFSLSGIGGGWVGGVVADTEPPEISNVGVCTEGVTETTADICWRTNELGTSQVEYWTSPKKFSPLDESLVTNHHVKLTGLTPSITYHYRTLSKDKAGNLVKSTEYTFTTLGEPPMPVVIVIPPVGETMTPTPEVVPPPVLETITTPALETTPHPTSEPISTIGFSDRDLVLIGIGILLLLGLIIEIIMRRRREFTTKSPPIVGVGAKSP